MSDEMQCEPRNDHCWHELSTIHLGGDSAIDVVCCHCGTRYTTLEKPDIPLGHGKFYPRTYRRIVSEDEAVDPESVEAAEMFVKHVLADLEQNPWGG